MRRLLAARWVGRFQGPRAPATDSGQTCEDVGCFLPVTAVRTRGSRNRHTPSRQRAILGAAQRLFARHGYERTTLDQICAALGVTKGSLYHHYAGKEGIARALYREAIDGVHGAINAALDQATDAESAVTGIVRSYLRWFAGAPDLARFVFEVMDGRAGGIDVSDVLARQEEFITAAARRLGAGRRARRLRKLPAPLQVALVLGPPRDFIRHWCRTPTRTAMRNAQSLLPAAVWASVRAD